MGDNEQIKMDVSGLEVDERQCECCGWNEHPIILTLHHVFPKCIFKPQPGFSRKYRYIIACPTCHDLIHFGIVNKPTQSLIEEKINTCAIEYSNYPDIKEIIDKCKRYYNL